VTLGYAASCAAKALLTFATGISQVVAFRVVERLGKSIRGVPRDALIASIAPRASRGAAFGAHKALDKAGAVVGPLCAYGMLSRLGHSPAAFRQVFTTALIPALASLAVLILFVRDRPSKPTLAPLRSVLRSLDPRCRRFFVTSALFSCCYFSWAFLLLAAARAGFEPKDVALLYALFNASTTLCAVPVGRLSDRFGRRRTVAASYLLYAGIALGFAAAPSRAFTIVLVALYGVFVATNEGQSRAYVSDLTPSPSRATAIGAYGLVTGLAYLPASLAAGIVWTRVGPHAVFAGAAVVALSALVHFVAFGPRVAAP
jgi:MFS family permease